jgi:hypothetical protein
VQQVKVLSFRKRQLMADRIWGFIHFALSLISFYFGFIRK